MVHLVSISGKCSVFHFAFSIRQSFPYFCRKYIQILQFINLIHYLLFCMIFSHRKVQFRLFFTDKVTLIRYFDLYLHFRSLTLQLIEYNKCLFSVYFWLFLRPPYIVWRPSLLSRLSIYLSICLWFLTPGELGFKFNPLAL